jgi:hypothetical protein
MTIRGGGNPRLNMAFVPRVRMGPPPRSFAADAYDCIMVQGLPGPTEYKFVARCSRLMASSPRIPDGQENSDQAGPTDPDLIECCAALASVKTAARRFAVACGQS